MKIELRRIKHTAEVRCAEPVEVIDGHLYIDGIKICDCAENAKGALPEGEYLVTITYCKQYKHKVLILSPACPELCRREGLRQEAATCEAIVTGDEVSGLRTESESCLEGSTKCEACEQLKWVFYDTTLPCYCPMLKIGNGVYNRPDGSIIVGTHIVPGCVLRSKDAYDPLYQRIRKSIERGNQVILRILRDENKL